MCSTFHSFAYALIRRYSPAELYEAPLRLLSAPEVLWIMDEVLSGLLGIADEREEEAPKEEIPFLVGQAVAITEGPFTDFNGAIEEVNYDKSKVRVSVTIFGRATPVELDFSQVEKI